LSKIITFLKKDFAYNLGVYKRIISNHLDKYIMEIKGTAVKTMLDYVKINQDNALDKWLNLLPAQSKKIFTEPIYATAWYQLNDSIVIPTTALAEILNEKPETVSWNLGRYSSEVALNGIYKIFLRISSPLFVLSRLENVITTYYRPVSSKIIEKAEKKAVFQAFKFASEERLAIYRIAGWAERTIETCGIKNLKVSIQHVEGPIEYSAIISCE